MSLCPCGSHLSYSCCCQPYNQGAPAPTAEALMRSRYSAFCLALQDNSLFDYLIDTYHPRKRANDDRKVLQQTTGNTHWLNLQIVDKKLGLVGDNIGTVEFIATFEEAGQLAQLHERSEFVREDGHWYYLEGEVFPSSLDIGRNDICPCGSEKKFKRCHG